MKLIFIACFASAIIAAQGFSSTELVKNFMDAGVERARLAMRPGFEISNQILTTMDPFAQDNIKFDLEALKYVVYDFLRCIVIIRFYQMLNNHSY